MTDLRKHLPRGYAKELAQHHHCSPDNVYKVAAGISTNTSIRIDLLKLANREAEALQYCQKLESRLNHY